MACVPVKFQAATVFLRSCKREHDKNYHQGRKNPPNACVTSPEDKKYYFMQELLKILLKTIHLKGIFRQHLCRLLLQLAVKITTSKSSINTYLKKERNKVIADDIFRSIFTVAFFKNLHRIQILSEVRQK